MQMPEAARKYVVDGIAATPVILSSLLHGMGNVDSAWDHRPDPDRFTLREVMAHLADWDDVFAQRIIRMRDDEHPFLESVDEGQLCLDRHYATQDPLANVERLKASRPGVVALLRALPESAWERTGHREFVGDVTLSQLAAMILGHDTYHLRQVAEFSAA